MAKWRAAFVDVGCVPLLDGLITAVAVRAVLDASWFFVAWFAIGLLAHHALTSRTQ